MDQVAATEDTKARWGMMLVGLMLMPILVYAGIIGFFGRAIYYGFMCGFEVFDDFFETEASKSRKSK